MSLPPSCAKLFDAIGVSEAIERAPFIRSTGNTVWWGSREPRVEMFAGGARGWQVETDALEAVMLEEAARAGVGIEHVAGEEPPHHSFVLDCTGRSGVIARAKGLRKYDDGPKTIALVASWRRDPGVAGARRHAHARRVVRNRLGLVGPRGGRHASHRCDGRSPAIGSGARRFRLATSTWRRSRRPSRSENLTAAASFVDGPWGWDASTYRCRSIRRRRVAAGRRRRLLHRSVVVGRREEGAGVGLARRHRDAHLPAFARRCDSTRSTFSPRAKPRSKPRMPVPAAAFLPKPRRATRIRSGASAPDDRASDTDDTPQVREAFERLRRAPVCFTRIKIRRFESSLARRSAGVKS